MNDSGRSNENWEYPTTETDPFAGLPEKLANTQKELDRVMREAHQKVDRETQRSVDRAVETALANREAETFVCSVCGRSSFSLSEAAGHNSCKSQE